MKLHLPKQLFTALLATMFVSLPCTLAGDSLSINFYSGDRTIGSQTEGSDLFGVDVTDWNDISASGAQTRELTVTTANEQNLLLTLITPQSSWGPSTGVNTSTLEDKLQASYLDVSANSSNSHWEIRLGDTGDMWLKDITFYMAGDGGTYDAINVNGTNYVGGVNQTGSDNWGDRSTNSDGSVSYSTAAGYDGSTAIADADLNTQRAVRVTGISGDIVAYNIDNTTGRGSLAGVQIVDSTDSRAYTATLGTTTEALSSIAWNKQGESESTTLANIADGSRYLSLTADAEGSSLQLTANATIDGLQLKENNLTVTSEGESELTVGALHANANTTLTMNLGLTGTNLALTGLGTISLSDYSYTGGITVSNSTTLHLQPGAQTSGQIINRGTVLLTRGNEEISLNSLVGKDLGQYKQAVVSNTSTGNLVIQHTGNATLSSDLTIANGGKVTLKGGTLGTADASITHKISGEANTELVLDGADAYVGADRALTINLHLINGTTLNLTHNDTLLYDNNSGSNTTTIGAGSFLNVGGYRQTVSSVDDRSVFVMAGGTIYGAGGDYLDPHYIYTAGLDFYSSGKITATENSLIATGIAARDSADKVTFDVASGKTLTLGVYYVDGEAVSSAALVGNGSFVKSGAGLLSYQVAPLSHALEITGGEFEYVMNDDRTHAGNISGTGTFAKSGTGALTLDSAKTSVSTLKVNAGEIIYNSSTDTTHTLAGAAGSKFTKNGSGTLTVATDSYEGDIEVSEGTLKFDGNAASSTNNSNREIAVQGGAVLDINGKARHYEVVLNQGATLTNTGAATGSDQRQLHTITLNGDATVSGTGNFYLINSNYTTTFLNLNQNTLTKTGTNTIYLKNTTVQSAGVIRVEGGTVETLSSTDGTLDISKASLEIADGGSFVLAGKNQQIQNLSLEAGGTLTVNNELTLTAQGAVAMSGGTVSGNLCLTGTMTLAGDVDLSGATLSGTSLAGFKMMETAKPTSSGFNSLSYQLWEGSGNVTTNQESIVVGGETYAFKSSAGTFSTADTVYYVVAGVTVDTGEATAGATSFVVDGTLNVTADTSATAITASTGTVNVASAATLSLTEAQVSSIGKLDASAAIINLAAGSTLNLGQSGADAQETTSSIGTVNVAESAATIHLTEKATLNPLTKTGNGTITLTGSGTYQVANNLWQTGQVNSGNPMQSGVTLGNAWEGTVKISNSQIMGVNLNSLGNAHSYVKLNGLGAWIHTSYTTINTNLILENYSDERSAFIITDSSGGNEYKFTGSVSGTGDFQLSSRAGSASTYTFDGDTSQWSGGIIIRPAYQGAPYNDTKTASSSYTVNLSGGGNVFAEGADGVTQDGGGTLTLVVGKTGSSTTMNGMITTTGNGGTLNLKATGSSVFKGSISGVNEITMTEGAQAQFANTVNATKVTVNGTAKFEKTLYLSGNLAFSSYASNQAELHSTGNSVSVLDLSNGNSSKGSLLLKTGATLEIRNLYTSNAGALWMKENTSVLLEDKASIQWGTATVTGTAGNNGLILAGENANQTISKSSLSLSNINLAVNDSSNSTAAAILTNSSVSNKGAGKLTVNNSGNTITSLTAEGGNVELAASMGVDSISAKKGKVVTVTDGNTIRMEGGVSIRANGDASMTAKTDSAMARLQADATFTIEDMTLTNTTVTAATVDTKVNLSNVSATNLALAKGNFVVTNQAATTYVGTGGSDMSFETNSYSGITLSNTGEGEGSSIVLNLGDLSCLTPMGPAVYDSITISLKGFTMSDDSTGILFAGDSWLGELLTAQDATKYVASGDVAAPANVGGGADGSTVGVSFSSDSVGTIIIITGLNVPEPASATLGLAALMMLCARRRRKA